MTDGMALDIVVGCVGSLTCGKRRWRRSFSFEDVWHDGNTNTYLTTEEMVDSVREALKEKKEVKEEDIVHCSECRYKKRFRDIWGDEFFTEEILDSFICIMLDKSVGENDYCYLAERKK